VGRSGNSPIVREIRGAGIATLDGIAAALNARGVRNLLAREVPASVST